MKLRIFAGTTMLALSLLLAGCGPTYVSNPPVVVDNGWGNGYYNDGYARPTYVPAGYVYLGGGRYSYNHTTVYLDRGGHSTTNIVIPPRRGIGMTSSTPPSQRGSYGGSRSSSSSNTRYNGMRTSTPPSQRTYGGSTSSSNYGRSSYSSPSYSRPSYSSPSYSSPSSSSRSGMRGR